MGELLHALDEAGKPLRDCAITPQALGQLIGLVEKGKINMPAAKQVFAELFAKGGEPEAIVKEKGLAQVDDAGAIEEMARAAIAANPKSVADYKAGKAAALMYLVGQVMKASRGKANPAKARALLERLLS